MDGHFVPNIPIRPEVIESIRNVTKISLDVHLMIADPHKYTPEFIKASDPFRLRYFETPDYAQTIQRIRKAVGQL